MTTPAGPFIERRRRSIPRPKWLRRKAPVATAGPTHMALGHGLYKELRTGAVWRDGVVVGSQPGKVPPTHRQAINMAMLYDEATSQYAWRARAR